MIEDKLIIRVFEEKGPAGTEEEPVTLKQTGWVEKYHGPIRPFAQSLKDNVGFDAALWKKALEAVRSAVDGIRKTGHCLATATVFDDDNDEYEIFIRRRIPDMVSMKIEHALPFRIKENKKMSTIDLFQEFKIGIKEMMRICERSEHNIVYTSREDAFYYVGEKYELE